MAEEAAATVSADASKPAGESTRPVDAVEGSTATEARPAESGDVAPADAPVEDQAPETTAATDDQAARDEATDAKSGAEAEAGEDTAPTEDAAANGTPASGKKANNNRRKSTGGIPEHKNKKTPSKKKKTAELHLDTQPGDMWMVAMRGYQPWPVIICDEEMLPESLLSKRPVSAKRIDGTYRDDFLEGGKNAKDRRYPIMFLGTNEFAWQVNTELLPYNEEEVKKEVASGNSAKKNKNLWDAYQIAAEGHDLDHFKDVLLNHEQAMQEDALSKAQKAEEKAKKAEKAAKRKSTAGVDSEDVEMGDADVPVSSKKTTKKRKKEDESEGDQGKPSKTPKLKIKNTPKEASAAKTKKEPKPKKSKTSEDEAEPAPAEEPPMTEEERLQKREKSVLYLRHRLQKGFISRDQAPKDEDMSNMSGYLKQLEELDDLEAEVIKNTKVHKVLKAIIKLNAIPKEEEFNFKQRSTDLLTKWSGALATATEAPTESAASAPPTTNGVKHDEETKADAPAPEKSDGPSVAPEAAKPADGDGDVSMTEAKDEAPSVKADAVTNSEGAAEAAETAVTSDV